MVNQGWLQVKDDTGRLVTVPIQRIVMIVGPRSASYLTDDYGFIQTYENPCIKLASGEHEEVIKLLGIA